MNWTHDVPGFVPCKTVLGAQNARQGQLVAANFSVRMGISDGSSGNDGQWWNNNAFNNDTAAEMGVQHFRCEHPASKLEHRARRNFIIKAAKMGWKWKRTRAKHWQWGEKEGKNVALSCVK